MIGLCVKNFKILVVSQVVQSATPSRVAFIAVFPSCRFAGHTSPCCCTCCHASTIRSISSIFLPGGRSLMDSCLTMPSYLCRKYLGMQPEHLLTPGTKFSTNMSKYPHHAVKILMKSWLITVQTHYLPLINQNQKQ